MPYIDEGLRVALRPESTIIATSEGELNFQITKLIIDYILKNGLNYERIGDVRGALANAGDEFYRRVAAPYEDLKIQENGDVYPAQLLEKATKGQDTFGGASLGSRANPQATPSTGRLYGNCGDPGCKCNRQSGS